MTDLPTRALILDRFPNLTPKLQEAARYLVDHPQEIVTTSMRTLARRSRLSPGTLIRLAQQLGFDGWPQLKEALFHDLGLSPQRYGARARALVGRAKTVNLVTEMFKTQRANLEATELQNGDTLWAAARILRRAKIVHIAAFRASYGIGYALAYGYRLFRSSVQLIDGQAGTLATQIFGIGSQDAVVVFGFAPYSRETLQVLESAKQIGARIVAITDSSASPLGLAADCSIIFSVDSPSYFPAISAAMVASEALLEILVAEGGNETAQRLDATEQFLIDSGAYQ